MNWEGNSTSRIDIRNWWKNTKGKPRINPISGKTVPTKSTKNPYQKQTEGTKTGKRVQSELTLTDIQ